MVELDKCLEVSKKLKRIEEQIIELKSRTMSPKNQIITDMPKSNGKQVNDIESYLLRLERLEQRKRIVINELNLKWNSVEIVFAKSGITDNETIALMKYRFYYGYQWKACLRFMQKDYKESKWNMNKCFYVYRSVLYKERHRIL